MLGVARGRGELAAALMLVAMLVVLSAPKLRAEEAGHASTGTAEQGEKDDSDERIDEIERKVDIVADELSRALTRSAVPEEKELIGAYGLGPAASKVYYRDKGLSIGGYGDVRLRASVTDQNSYAKNGDYTGKKRVDDIFDALRAVLYVGYKFNDKWVVNSELEFEHAGGSGGSVSLEFLTVDYLATDFLGFRAGLVLIPMGFINEMHEPPFYFGAERPEVERQIIPSTWRENGAGVFGTLGDRVHYRMYGVNGFKAAGFSSDGLRGGRQKGSQALANHWAFVARADVDVISGITVGGSVYTGPSGQHATNTYCTANCAGPAPPAATLTTFKLPNTLTTIYEVHAEVKTHGVSMRGLYTQAFLQDVSELNLALNRPATNSIARQMLGWYAEIGYDVLPLVLSETRASLEPFFRYERLDTQHVMDSPGIRNYLYVRDIYTVGASFKPIPQIVFKLDYRNIRPKSDPQDVSNQVQASVGYVF